MKAGEVVVLDKAYVDFKHLKTLSNKSTHKIDALKKQVSLYSIAPQKHSFHKKWDGCEKKRFFGEKTPDWIPALLRHQHEKRRTLVKYECSFILTNVN